MSKTIVGISRDHSGSMSSLARAATKDYNECVKSIKTESYKSGQDTYVSVVSFGNSSVGYGGVELLEVNAKVDELDKLTIYRTGGNTPLFDSVGELIKTMKNAPGAKRKDSSFLVMVITDGEENASNHWNSSKLMSEIKKLQATDQWTFVFRTPRGYGAKLSRDFGIPAGNILEWDQTEQGLQVAMNVTSNSIGSYYGGRARGVTATRSFFADIDRNAQQKVKRVLKDVSADYNKVKLNNKHDGEQIRDVCETIFGSYQKGNAFYELTKPEEVQEYKEFLILETATGHVYAGADARDLLGLPEYGSIRLRPGNTGGKYDIFVQSTSINRKVQGGTTLFYKV